MPKIVKRVEGICDRCARDDGPYQWQQMARGERKQWLCRRCIHVFNTARRYHIDYQDYERRMLGTEVCDICHAQLPCGKFPHVDVDAEGEFRGIVCARCKFIVGHSGNDAVLLNRISVYINNKRFLKGKAV